MRGFFRRARLQPGRCRRHKREEALSRGEGVLWIRAALKDRALYAGERVAEVGRRVRGVLAPDS